MCEALLSTQNLGCVDSCFFARRPFELVLELPRKHLECCLDKSKKVLDNSDTAERSSVYVNGVSNRRRGVEDYLCKRLCVPLRISFLRNPISACDFSCFS